MLGESSYILQEHTRSWMQIIHTRYRIQCIINYLHKITRGFDVRYPLNPGHETRRICVLIHVFEKFVSRYSREYMMQISFENVKCMLRKKSNASERRRTGSRVIDLRRGSAQTINIQTSVRTAFLVYKRDVILYPSQRGRHLRGFYMSCL